MIGAAQKLEAKICYCSVFEECYLANSADNNGRATPVTSCPAVAGAFQDNEDMSDLGRADKAGKK